MSYSTVTAVTGSPIPAADINKLMENIDLVKGGTAGTAPTTTVESLATSKADASTTPSMASNAGATDEIIVSAGANKTQKTSSKKFETTITDDDTKIPTSGSIVDYALPLAGGTVSGYTALGSDAPKIKMKKYTGTTNASQSASVSISHGLTSSKIISVNVLVEYSAGNFVIPSYDYAAGSKFTVVVTTTSIDVYNSSSSTNILSKPIKAVVIYEE